MEGFNSTDARGKVSMKKLFGRKNITKDGKEGKVRFMTLRACDSIMTLDRRSTNNTTFQGWHAYNSGVDRIS